LFYTALQLLNAKTVQVYDIIKPHKSLKTEERQQQHVHYLYGYPSCFDRNTDRRMLKKKTTETRAHTATTANKSHTLTNLYNTTDIMCTYLALMASTFVINPHDITLSINNDKTTTTAYICQPLWSPVTKA